jgi:HAD superfamily phosphatase (TIGR01668 family)
VKIAERTITMSDDSRMTASSKTSHFSNNNATLKGRARVRAFFFPDAIVASPDVIPYGKFRDKGIRAVFLDLDNTLAIDGSYQADTYTKQLVAHIREAGLTPVIVSNAEHERALAFAASVPAECIPKAKKPSTDIIRAYIMENNWQPHEILMVGDQLLTDVLCARRLGMNIILTKQRAKHEIIPIRLKRHIEKCLILLGGYRHWKILKEKGQTL